MKHGKVLLLGLATTLALSGCNLFTALHSDGNESNANVLVADGNGAMQRQDYAKAAEYYTLAMEKDPRNSEARVGYAHALVKVQGFSLGEFANSFFSAMQSDSGSSETFDLLTPSQWGVATYTEAANLMSQLIAVLDPVVMGYTSGPYRSTDVNLNLTVGVFYVLRIIARLENLSTEFSIHTLTKGTPEVDALGLPASVLDQLPDEFLWLLDSAGQQPSLSFLTDMQQDITAAILRLQTAADHSGTDSLQEIVDEFKSWEILAYQ